MAHFILAILDLLSLSWGDTVVLDDPLGTYEP